MVLLWVKIWTFWHRKLLKTIIFYRYVPKIQGNFCLISLSIFWQKWTFWNCVINTYICNFVPSVSLSLIHVDFRCSFSTLHMISAPHCVIFGLWRKNSSWPHRNVFDQLHIQICSHPRSFRQVGIWKRWSGKEQESWHTQNEKCSRIFEIRDGSRK